MPTDLGGRKPGHFADGRTFEQAILNARYPFAWMPTRVHRLHKEPKNADPLVKALMNGWWPDGWVWLRRTRRIENMFGQVFHERVRSTDTEAHGSNGLPSPADTGGK